MPVYDDVSNRHKSRAAADRVISELGSRPSLFQFSDNRPAAIAQRKLLEIIQNSPQVRRKAQLQTKAEGYGIRAEDNSVVQRRVFASATPYRPAQLDLDLIDALDDEMATSETNARNEVRDAAPSTPHTNHQAAYMRKPTPRAWGNCVEEKLNGWAIGNGWSIRNLSGGSNPDYSRTRAETKIWADLTTERETGAGGAHIADKLSRKVNKNEDDSTWVAADVVHQGLDPLRGVAPVVPLPNGTVTTAHREAFQAFTQYQRSNDYDPVMEGRIREAGEPSFATFTQSWDEEDRDTFTAWILMDDDHDTLMKDKSS